MASATFDLSMVAALESSSFVAGGQAMAETLKGVAAAEQQAEQGANELDDSMRRLRVGLAGIATAARAQQAELKATAAAQKEVEAQQRRFQASSVNVNRQISDITQSLALGMSPMMVFGQQAGQTADALTGMGGKAAVVGRFLAGPWGSLIIAAATVIGLFVSHLNSAEKALELAKTGADALGTAQGVLGGMFDLTSGKIQHQNELLLVNARLTAINLRADAQLKRETASRTFQEAQESHGGTMRSIRAWTQGRSDIDPGQDLIRPIIAAIQNAKTPADKAKALDAALRKTDLHGNSADTDVIKNLIGVSGKDWRQALIDTATADQNDNIAGLIDKSLNSGSLAGGLRRDARTKRTPKAKSRDGIEEFGRDAAVRIRELAASFTDVPPQVQKVNKGVADLDDLIDDLARKKPTNFKELISEAERAKGVIEAGINKPYNDFILKQNDALAVQQLITAGRGDEADAMQIILQLQQQQGPLTQAQKDGVLATVEALHAQQRETDILRQKQQKYLDALHEVKDALRGVISDPLKGLADLPKKLINAFANLKADQIFEKMFGSTFRDIEDKITGSNVAKDAAEKMATAVDHVSTEVDATTAALASLGAAANKTAGALGGGPAGSTGGGRETLPDSIIGVVDDLNGTSSGRVNNAAASGGDIVVNGERTPRNTFSGWIEKLSKGVGISDEGAKKIGAFGGKAIEGAATGAMVNSFLNPLGKALGFKTSQTGAQIGGAIGSFIPIPGGEIIGSIVGSIAGGLLKKSKTGSATITDTTGNSTLSGNNSAMQKAAGGMATSVQDTLAGIADTLGGGLGAFSVSIGQKDGKWRVDPTGSGNVKVKKGALDFGDDSAAAAAAAVLDALRDGAVTGLSQAVTAALNSSSDINRALSEALKVKNLEELIGGLGSKLEATFRDYDTQAAERVRLAQKYGLDLLAVEKINAEQRADLLNQVLQGRIGGLVDFQNEMKFGDLFEGDAATRRKALMDEIAKVQPDAEAGKDGAADQLVDLYRRLIGTSEEAFGTAGTELPADRALAAAGVARVIELENQRVADAAKQGADQTDALKAGNALTDETNDLLAVTNNKLDTIAGLLASAGFVASGANLSLVSRTSVLN